MLNIIKNTINRVFASGVDSDASAFITATGLSGTTQKSAITTLVKDLKSSGLWSKMKAVYPIITDQRNSISYSEDLSNGYWGKANLSITSNAINSPIGTLTADKIVEAATTGFHYMSSGTGSMTSTNNYTSSTYFKAGERNWVYLYLYNGASGFGAYFNLSNGSIGTVDAGVTAVITDAGNGWYRCSVSGSVTGSPAGNTGITLASADNVTSYTGVAGNGIYQWGFQLEVGTTASAYQPILTTPSAFMASQMKYNLKDARDLDAAFRLTWSGGWTYSATGATPNGTNAYADTKLLPSTNLSQNSTHLSSYIRNTSQGVLLGTDNAFRLWIAPNFNGINKYVEINSGATTAPSATISSATGLWVGNRIINTQSRLYNNNSLNYTATSTSAGLDTSNIFLSARNAGGASNYTSSQVAFASIGDGLSEQETLLLNQITEKYQVALSRGVQAARSFYYNSAYSNEANTYLYSTQITGTTQVSAINTLINGLKANNLWTKMKAVYPFVTDKTLQADMAAQMKFNLVNPQDTDAAFRLAFSGGWTYSTNGAQPNGTNGYANTYLVPSTALTLNSTHLSFYSRTNQAAGNIYEFGVSPDPSDLPLMLLSARFTGDLIRSSQYDYNLTQIYTANADSTGYYSNTRTSVNSHKVYKNGALLATNTVTSIQALPYTQPMYMSAGNFQGTANRFSSKQVAFASIGTGLTDAEAALLYSLVQQFQTDLTRQV
jgi:hypothetical protein